LRAQKNISKGNRDEISQYLRCSQYKLSSSLGYNARFALCIEEIMPIITLPDGSQRQFDHPVTGLDIATDIGPGLAKAAIAIKVDGEQRDIYHQISEDANVSILTSKDEEGLDVLRHTLAAQILARAIKTHFPTAKLAIGPTIEHGFYYDVEFPQNITPEDLATLEATMRKIIKEGNEVTRELWARDEAISYFENKGESYKAEIIRDTPESEQQISLYRQGNNGEDTFMDLCRGPHLRTVSQAGEAFKLTTLAGAYWRGNSDNQQLTRIYGVAFADKKQLKAHLHMLEEAQKRDHRRIGKQLDLFHLQEHAPGMVFWHAKGWTIWQIIEQYIRQKLIQADYQEVKTPQIADRSLWEASGHWENYRENMFTTESEKRLYAVKPMNCPCHVQIFNNTLHSYRDLPLRMAEFGSCHRNEPSGALHGIMRVRGFTQDDGHIFCTNDQVTEEVINFNTQLMELYKDFGFTDIEIKLALRPDKRAGSDEVWDKAEEGLREALRASNVEWEEMTNEGAFYGPKIEYHLKDTIGRSWQCGTMQLDFVLPERLDAVYIAEDNSRQRPVMLHRAIVGSMERFIGILIENYAGTFPLWLAPTQAVVIGITNQLDDAVISLGQKLQQAGIRVITDTSNNKVSYKVREYAKQKVPLTLVLGNKEVEDGTVSVRRLGSDQSETLAVDNFLNQIQQQIANKK
jgi:threonyl-tRNA synthetase